MEKSGVPEKRTDNFYHIAQMYVSNELYTITYFVFRIILLKKITEYMEESADLHTITTKLYHIMSDQVHLSTENIQTDKH
jgi:hypothetical protein